MTCSHYLLRCGKFNIYMYHHTKQFISPKSTLLYFLDLVQMDANYVDRATLLNVVRTDSQTATHKSTLFLIEIPVFPNGFKINT